MLVILKLRTFEKHTFYFILFWKSYILKVFINCWLVRENFFFILSCSLFYSLNFLFFYLKLSQIKTQNKGAEYKLPCLVVGCKLIKICLKLTITCKFEKNNSKILVYCSDCDSSPLYFIFLNSLYPDQTTWRIAI